MPEHPEQKDTPPPEKPERPFAESLCWRCVNHREINTARSTFVLCSALAVKYPRQPVRTCSAFREGPP
jgi:hypothetical protein